MSRRTVYRGFTVRFGSEDAAEAIRRGFRPVLLKAALEGRGENALRTRLNGAGLGVHWTTSLDVAKTFSHPMTHEAESYVDSYSAYHVPVVVTATVDSSDVVTDEDALRDAMVEGHGWTGLPSTTRLPEDEALVRDGAKVQVVKVEAVLPARMNGVSRVVNSFGEGWHGKDQSWVQIGGGMAATAKAALLPRALGHLPGGRQVTAGSGLWYHSSTNKIPIGTALRALPKPRFTHAKPGKVYFTPDPWIAAFHVGGISRFYDDRAYLYRVEPIGEIEDDPEVLMKGARYYGAAYMADDAVITHRLTIDEINTVLDQDQRYLDSPNALDLRDKQYAARRTAGVGSLARAAVSVPDVLYHGTTQQRLPSILSRGVVPTHSVVWLHHDRRKGAKVAHDASDGVLLRLTGLDPAHLEHRPVPNDVWVYHGSIPSEHIEVVPRSEWEPWVPAEGDWRYLVEGRLIPRAAGHRPGGVQVTARSSRAGAIPGVEGKAARALGHRVGGIPVTVRTSSLHTAGQTRLYHLTNTVNFKLKAKSPERNTTMGGEMKPGIFLCDSAEPWVNGYGYWRPWVVEFQVPANLTSLEGVHSGGYIGEIYVETEQFDQLRIKRVMALDAYCREEFSDYGWTEEFFGTTFDTGERYTAKGHHDWTGYRAPDARQASPAWQAAYKKRVTKFRRESGRPGVYTSGSRTAVH